MKTYEVQITETLQRIVEVEAKDGNEAWELIHGRYYDEGIVLDADDCQGVEIEVVE